MSTVFDDLQSKVPFFFGYTRTHFPLLNCASTKQVVPMPVLKLWAPDIPPVPQGKRSKADSQTELNRAGLVRLRSHNAEVRNIGKDDGRCKPRVIERIVELRREL